MQMRKNLYVFEFLIKDGLHNKLPLLKTASLEASQEGYESRKGLESSHKEKAP